MSMNNNSNSSRSKRSRSAVGYNAERALQRVVAPVSILRGRSQSRVPAANDDFASLPVVLQPASRSESRASVRRLAFDERQRAAFELHQSAHAQRMRDASANRDHEAINRALIQQQVDSDAREHARIRELAASVSRRRAQNRRQVANDRHEIENNVVPIVNLGENDPNEAMDIPDNRGIDIMQPENAVGPLADIIQRRTAAIRRENNGQKVIINVIPYDEEVGGTQSRHVEVKVTGFYVVMEGREISNKSRENDEHKHVFHLKGFSSQANLLRGIDKAIQRTINMIANISIDSGYKEFYPILSTITGLYSPEEIRMRAHNPTQIRLHASLPIVYGFLERMGVNVELVTKRENKELNCLTAAVLSHIVKHNIMKRLKLTEKKIALELLDGEKLMKGETLANRGYSINDGKNFFDKYEAFNVYIFDQTGNVLWRSEYNKDGKKRLAPPFMGVAHNAHMYTITNDKIRNSLMHRVSASSRSVKSNLFSNEDKEKSRVAKEEKLTALLARKRFNSFQWKEDAPLDLEKLNTYNNCNLFMDKKCLHSTMIELFRQQNYIHTGEYSVHGFSRINYFNDVTIWCNPNTSPSLIKKEILLKGSSATTAEVCRRFGVLFKNQSVGSATHSFADRYFNPLGAKSARPPISPKQRSAHILRFKNICQLCKKDAGKKGEIDHIIRREAGGIDDDSNLQLLCKGCHDAKTRQEVNIFRQDRTISHFNTATVPIFARSKNAFIHNYVELDEFGHLDDIPSEDDINISSGRCQFRVKDGILLAGIDMQKCRTNILRFGMDNNEFADFTVLDDIIVFDSASVTHNQIPPGEYYVHTRNICPAKGNGWLTHVEVRYMLEEKIIDFDQIKWIVRASLSHPSDYYSKMVEGVLEKLIISPEGTDAWKTEVHIAKSCVNQFIGTWGTRAHEYKSISVYNSLEAAATDSYLRSKGESSVQIATSEKKNNDTLRAGQTAVVVPRLFAHNKASEKKLGDYDYIETIYKSTSTKQESHVPIFRTVLGQEAVHLHKTMRILERFGGVIVNCNTDNAIAMFKDRKIRDKMGNNVTETAQEQIDKMWEYAEKVCWDKKCKVKKYKRADRPSTNSLNRMEEASEDEFKYTAQRYKIEKDPGFKDQQECKFYAEKLVDRLLNSDIDGSTQIDALAGTGKTTLTNHVISALTERGVSYLAVAPTHVASRLLGDDGKTMQSALSCLKHGNYGALSGYKVIILDEKSMVKELYWGALCMLKKNTNIRFLIVGCWDQLPPVADRSALFDYEHSAAIHELCGGNMLRLSVCRRSDTLLFDQYKDISVLDVNLFGNNHHPTSICFYNPKVHELNNTWMNHYVRKQKKHMLIKTSEKAKTLQKCQDILLFNGLPLMACATKEADDLYNSERWRVVKWDKNNVSLVSDNDGEKERREMIAVTSDLACMFRPAYSYTVHKSQGSTIRKPYSIYNWGHMSNRMRYVAVSRGVSIADVNIMRSADGKFL